MLAPDGQRKLEVSLEDDLQNPLDLGRRAAEELLGQGAAELINLARE